MYVDRTMRTLVITRVDIFIICFLFSWEISQEIKKKRQKRLSTNEKIINTRGGTIEFGSEEDGKDPFLEAFEELENDPDAKALAQKVKFVIYKVLEAIYIKSGKSKSKGITLIASSAFGTIVYLSKTLVGIVIVPTEAKTILMYSSLAGVIFREVMQTFFLANTVAALIITTTFLIVLGLNTVYQQAATVFFYLCSKNQFCLTYIEDHSKIRMVVRLFLGSENFEQLQSISQNKGLYISEFTPIELVKDLNPKIEMTKMKEKLSSPLSPGDPQKGSSQLPESLTKRVKNRVPLEKQMKKLSALSPIRKLQGKVEKMHDVLVNIKNSSG